MDSTISPELLDAIDRRLHGITVKQRRLLEGMRPDYIAQVLEVLGLQPDGKPIPVPPPLPASWTTFRIVRCQDGHECGKVSINRKGQTKGTVSRSLQSCQDELRRSLGLLRNESALPTTGVQIQIGEEWYWFIPV